MMEGQKNIVLGAGPAGLGAAWVFAEQGDRPVTVVELQSRVGGLAGTFERNGMRLDYGPHKFYTQFGYLLEKMKALLGPDLLTVQKRSGVWLLGRRFEYPVVVKELLFGLSPMVAMRCGFSYLLSVARQSVSGRRDITYEDYLVNRFGRQTYRLIFEPLARKIWGDPKTLDADLARVRVVIPSLFEMLSRLVLGDRGKPELSAKVFYYPRQGYMEFWRRITQLLEAKRAEVLLKARPVVLGLENGRASWVDVSHGERTNRIPAFNIVSTIPILHLLQMIEPAPPTSVLEAAARLRYRATILLYLVVRKPRVSSDAWIFFPEAKYLFNRIAEQKAFSEEMIPRDRTVLVSDISCEHDGEIWRQDDRALFDTVMHGLEETGLVRCEEVEEFFTVRIPRVYPVYDLSLKSNMDLIWAYLDRIPNLISAGRHGYFQHNNSDNAMDMGIQAAEHLLGGRSRDQWRAQRERFAQYQIVD